MNNNKEFLATEPIGRLLVKLAVPTVAAQMINMLYNIVDRIYIGHIPGTGSLALTGVGVCMPLIMIISAFAALVGNGGAPRASILMGKGDNEKAEKILGNCFMTQLIISVILTFVMYLFNRPLLLAFGASENTIEYAVSYMNIYALGTLFVQLTLGMNTFITAQGFAKTGMLSVLIGAIVNIALDPIFIFALNMGVAGAALATIISQACSCIWVLSFLFGKKTTLRIKKQNLALKPEIILPCLALGLSLFIMQASESIISVCFNSSLLKYGGDVAVGAMTILTSVMQFAMLPLQGLGQGAQPIMSYNYVAFFEAADFSEEGATTDRGHVKSFFQSNRGLGLVHQAPAELGNLDGIGNCAEHGKGKSTGNISSKTYVKSHVKITADGSDSGSNVGVGFRAMGDVNTLVFDHLDFLICGMNTVGHDSRA